MAVIGDYAVSVVWLSRLIPAIAEESYILLFGYSVFPPQVQMN